MYDALVFDLDGTLWDASESSTMGWNNGLSSLNSNRLISIEEMNKVTGKPFEECVKTLCPDEFKQHHNLLNIISQYEEISIKSMGGKLYNRLHEVIKSLSERYDLYLVSNCQEWYLNVFFDFSNLKMYFKDYDCHGKSKSNKSEMLKILKEKYDFKNPVYIGDTESDELAAKDAGYSFIFAKYGFGISNKSDIAIESLEELLTNL